jgi:hypothetical protein
VPDAPEVPEDAPDVPEVPDEEEAEEEDEALVPPPDEEEVDVPPDVPGGGEETPRPSTASASTPLRAVHAMPAHAIVPRSQPSRPTIESVAAPPPLGPSGLAAARAGPVALRRS